MADYYPLLSRAVSGLGSSNEAARKAIYERARKALLGQLQAIQPPVPQADIDREAKALDEAVARIEAEIAVTAAIGEALTPAPVSPPAPAQPVAPAPAQPVAPPIAQPVAPARAPSPLAAPRMASPQPPYAPAAAAPAVAMSPPSPAAPPVAPPPLPSSLPPAAPALSPALATGLRPPAPGNLAAASDAAPAHGLPPARIEMPGSPVSTALEPGLPPAPRTPTPPAGRRPAAGVAQAKGRKSRTGLYAALAALVLLTAGAAGYLAWSWRLLPDQLSKPRAGQNATTEQASAPAPSAPAAKPAAEQRIVQRVPSPGAAPAETPSAAPVQTAPQSQPAASAQQQPQTPPAETGVPVAQRAAILIAAPSKESPDGVDTRIGTVVWRTDTITRDGGQPPSSAIRADIDIQPAGIKAVMTIEKNLDATLPASHMITIRFQRENNNATGEIGDIETIQMRDLQSPQVESLESARVKITSNIFIVALTQSEAITKRNVDAMQARGWIDIPMKLADGRLAKITIEKGAPGERIFKEAFERWAQ